MQSMKLKIAELFINETSLTTVLLIHIIRYVAMHGDDQNQMI